MLKFILHVFCECVIKFWYNLLTKLYCVGILVKRTLSEILSDTRKDRNLKQKDVAERLEIAISTLSSWETGANEPPIKALIELADIYHVNMDYLLGHEEESISWGELLTRISICRDKSIQLSGLLKALNDLSEQDQKEVLNYIRYLRYKNSI